MAISWKLKTFLTKKHSITKATQMQKLIKDKTGTIISLQNICNYLNSQPKSLKLETVEIICIALDCKLSDFCEVKPSKKKNNGTKKLSYKNTPHSKRGLTSFPNPDDY